MASYEKIKVTAKPAKVIKVEIPKRPPKAPVFVDKGEYGRIAKKKPFKSN